MLSALEELRKIRASKSVQTLISPQALIEQSFAVTGGESDSPTADKPALGRRQAEYSPAASAVIGILVETGQPVLHSQIVKALVGRGQSKKWAREGIDFCQARGWIEHNLVTGYKLS